MEGPSVSSRVLEWPAGLFEECLQSWTTDYPICRTLAFISLACSTQDTTIGQWPGICHRFGNLDTNSPADKSHLFDESDLEPVERLGARSVQWILQISIDTSIVTAAARMVSEVEWPEKDIVTDMLQRQGLERHFYACLNSSQRLRSLPHTSTGSCLPKSNWPPTVSKRPAQRLVQFPAQFPSNLRRHRIFL